MMSMSNVPPTTIQPPQRFLSEQPPQSNLHLHQIRFVINIYEI
jgi:hypothetical protein